MIGHEACDRRIAALETEIARLTAERDEARREAEDLRLEVLHHVPDMSWPLPWESGDPTTETER